MDAETGFVIDGKVYEVPALDSLTMGERRVMFELSGMTQEEFVREADESEDEHAARVAKLVRHPGFAEALMHVAYQRGNPTAKRDKVSLVIEGTNYIDAIALLGEEDEQEENAAPLASTSEHKEPSSSGSLGSENLTKGSSASSGTDGGNDSAELALYQVPTGLGRLDTSSQESRVQTSAH